uniref:Uncharacterized protein n=1 Tax=Arion vulgaris TaxID=1028688 RepID=A0A0B6ZPI8_9EUPU
MLRNITSPVLKKHINADTRKQRNKRDNSRIISDRAMNSKNENGQTRTNKKKDFDYQEKWKYSTSIPGGVKQAEDSDKLRGEVKGKKHDEVDGNDTENWNRMSWKQRRKSLDIKCKWIKIPYPVTDNCFCSC